MLTNKEEIYMLQVFCVYVLMISKISMANSKSIVHSEKMVSSELWV